MKAKRFAKRYLNPSRYITKSNLNSSSFQVVEFRKIRASDACELDYQAWSRIYEYPLMISCIERCLSDTNISVHNSSWGFEGVHVLFKERLEAKYREVVNSDILPSPIPNTCVMDITEPPANEYRGKFDVVLNVSTVEEIENDHVMIIGNLLDQVRVDGYLVITFDIPGMQMGKLERLLGKKIDRFDDELNGTNSAAPNSKFAKLSCGLLILKKLQCS
ncbi:MAG: hypothetical protein ACSHXK_17235 [Oceanococcus sp.]